MNKVIRNSIKNLSLEHKPEEVCGLILKKDCDYHIHQCKNIAEDKQNNFFIDPKDYYIASKNGDIFAMFHSQESSTPSALDYSICKSHNIYSYIYSWINDIFIFLDPKNITTCKYSNKDFKIGENDCFSLIRDYYKNEKNIEIKNYSRDDEFVKNTKGFIESHFKDENFEEVQDLKKDDVLCFTYKGEYIHHFGIYLGKNLILHHERNRKSCVEILSEGAKKHISKVLRHKNYII